MSISFKPAPTDTVDLFGERFAFRQHPAVNFPTVYGVEGGRATVYEVRDRRGRRHALKVFKPPFRDPTLADSGNRLRDLQSTDGFTAAERRVVLPGDDAVRRHPDLAYALLMPWVEGDTWTEIMLRGASIPPDVSLFLCARFLKVVGALESRGYSHTDLAGGNVVARLTPASAQLLDLEDMYQPGAPPASVPRGGSPGYRHPAGESVFRAEGDRYAAAVLAAEILAMSSPTRSDPANDTGLFPGPPGSPEGERVYASVQPWLTSVAPAFAENFERAWRSPCLADCPRIEELRASLPVSPPDVPTVPFVPGVTWGPAGGGSASPLHPPAPVPVPMPLAPVVPAANGNVRWMTTTSPPPPTTPQPAPANPIPMWLLVVVGVVLALLLIAAIAGEGASAAIPGPV